MKTSSNKVSDFETLIIKIADKNVDGMTRSEAERIIRAVSKCRKPMFWLICVMMGLREGSSYAVGARKIRKDLGW
ncbi:MAG TPA: hypothetical protein PKL56_15175 [Cyclobacteriaceae bacterium]|nr:hypothetical protein [Cyclobacteriaceae bacterium]HMX49416.1 hypothetical protein [Cyclobacteriaceae bacterium]HMY93512.1 hypothetical protein [Cyclobacteriaceae bacterium]HNA13053.1 hypothetical protein [Cyclobacteriaceae bacterium]HNC10983.1 hypothetical protein [Cyclobacteriaceae bacterium]